jgi:hypothetical protein
MLRVYKAEMKPSDRINNFVRGRREKRYAHGFEAAPLRNVSGHIQDPEAAAYITKLLDVIDEMSARLTKLEKRPQIVSLPRRYAANQ